MPPIFPTVQRIELKTPPLALVVCQLRFPPILQLDDHHPPERYQEELRAEYPVVGIGRNVSIDQPQPDLVRAKKEAFWTFEDKGKQWTISLGQTFLSIETRHYRRFDDFISRFNKALNTARRLYPIEVRERIGLRFVDRISLRNQRTLPPDWLRKMNLQFVPLRSSRTEGEPQMANLETRFAFGDRVLAIRSAYVDEGFLGAADTQLILDFDCYSEVADGLDAIEPLLREFKVHCYDAFRFAMGDLIKCFEPVSVEAVE